MATQEVAEIERLCSNLARRVAEDWDWDLIGGNWPVDQGTLEELARLSSGTKRTAGTGTPHRMERRTLLRGYRWKRVYDSDGKIGYDLVKP